MEIFIIIIFLIIILVLLSECKKYKDKSINEDNHKKDNTNLYDTAIKLLNDNKDKLPVYIQVRMNLTKLYTLEEKIYFLVKYYYDNGKIKLDIDRLSQMLNVDKKDIENAIRLLKKKGIKLYE